MKILSMLILTAVLLSAQDVMFTVDGDIIRPPFNIHKYATLVRLMDEFDRKMAGCPPHSRRSEECVVGAGVLDLKLLKKIQTLAPEALGLPGAKASLRGSGKGSKQREP